MAAIRPRTSGRRAPHPESTHPRLHASAVLTANYTGAVPAVVDWFSGMPLPMDLNDSLGDCTIADVAHAVTVYTAFGQGIPVVLTEADVLAMYERVGGYVPGRPDTDGGCVIQDVLADWRKNGIGSPAHRIAAYLSVDYTNLAELKACCWLFGGVTLGVNFPTSAMTQFNANQPWDYNPAADNTIEGGHDVRILGFEADGTMRVATWGTIVTMTPAWLAHFADEAWCEADKEWITKTGGTPEGLSLVALNAAYTQITGAPGPFTAPVPPAPTPVPPVPPAPTPPGPVPGVTPEQTAANTALATLAHKWIASKHILPSNEAMVKELGFWLQAWGL